jgi:hypothetical protein
MNQSQFATAVLKGLGVQPSDGAVTALVGWMKAEGGHWNNDAHFNPLNTTMPAPGAGNTGSQGNIKVYKNWAQGVDATVRTLKNGRYTGIIHALSAGNPKQVAAAIGASPWGTNASLIAGTIAHAKPQKANTAAVQRTLTTTTTPGTPSKVIAAHEVPDPQAAALLTLSQGAGKVPKKLPKLGADGALDKYAYNLSQTTTTAPTEYVAGQSAKSTASLNAVKRATAPPGMEPSDGQAGEVNFEGKKVAAWIAPALHYARDHGWKGKVNSGYRSFAEQTRIYNSGVRPAAKPGTSNHEGAKFPRGAVDVSEAEQLSTILKDSPYASKLVWAGGKDPVHFSHPHGGSY